MKRTAAAAFLYGCALVQHCHASESSGYPQRKPPPPPPPPRQPLPPHQQANTVSASDDGENHENKVDNPSKTQHLLTGRIPPPPPPPPRDLTMPEKKTLLASSVSSPLHQTQHVSRLEAEDRRLLYTPSHPVESKEVPHNFEGRRISKVTTTIPPPPPPPPLRSQQGDGLHNEFALEPLPRQEEVGDPKGRISPPQAPNEKEHQDSDETLPDTIDASTREESKMTTINDLLDESKAEEFTPESSSHAQSGATLVNDDTGRLRMRADVVGTASRNEGEQINQQVPPADTVRPSSREHGSNRLPLQTYYQNLGLPPSGVGMEGDGRASVPQTQGYSQSRSYQQYRPPEILPPAQPGANLQTNQQPPPFQQGYTRQRMPPQRGPPPHRLDPRQIHDQANAQQRQAAPPPTWRRLWRRIEGSLDGLADLEDNLGGKARQIYSSTVDTAAVTIQRTSRVLKQRGKPSFRPPPARPSNPRKPPNKAENAAPSKPQQPSLIERVGRKSDPQFTTRMPTSQADSYKTNADLVGSKPPTQPVSRAINWDDVMHKKTRRVIRANGGASNPMENVSQQTSDALDPSHHSQSMASSKPASGENTENPKPVLKQAFPASSFPSPTFTYRPPRQTVTPQSKQISHSSIDDSPSWKEKLGALVPSLPKFRFRGSSLPDYSSAMDAWKADDEAFKKPRKGFFGLFAKPDDSLPFHVDRKRSKEPSSATKIPSTLASLEEKSDPDRSFALIAEKDRRICHSLGRAQSLWDMAALLFFLFGIRRLPAYSGLTPAGQPIHQYVEVGVDLLKDFMDTWAPFAFAAAVLSHLSSKLIFEKHAKGLARDRQGTIADDVQYGRLFLRLFTSETIPKSTLANVGTAVYEETLTKVQLSRLRSFVSLAICTISVVALRFLQPVFQAIASAVLQISGLKALRTWPPAWGAVRDTLRSTTEPLLQLISTMFLDAYHALAENPLRVTYEASIVLALFTATLLPNLELKRKTLQPKVEDDEDDVVSENYERFSYQVLDMGASSSTRLTLLAESVEGTLERWRQSLPPDVSESPRLPFSSLVRLCAYGLLGSALLVLPVMVYSHVGIMPAPNQIQVIQWDSLFDLAVVLFFSQGLVWKALYGAFKAKNADAAIVGFLDSVRNAIEERKKLLESPTMNLQLQASISPTAGLAVRDLWAAHATKRAWAVRGANLSCRNGEVLLVLGDESAGKTRLLTTVAEAFLSPPHAARTVTRINRGSISLGGLDVSKWDSASLKKRLGVVLNDVRTTSDKAKVLSGLTMEEILEPFDGLRSIDPSHTPSLSERACITQALHITGLHTSLLPRLPSKMSTVVTANEEDLKPSPFRAHSAMLSPGEWSKVLLARVLSQTIFDNDSTAHNSDKFENCLFGSLLLLDDVTAGLSEMEEGRLVKNLRQTGAAVVLTSNRWAAGRWADRVVVVRDGAIVESGTHAELLSRGAQKSLYASNWHAMTALL